LIEIPGVLVPPFALWCERGEPAFLESKKELSLSDYSFLYPFVDEEVAIELGWLHRAETLSA
jgi:hypothetical protein